MADTGERYIRGGAVKFIRTKIPIDDLLFDPDNPRIHSSVNEHRTLEWSALQEKLHVLLTDEAKISELKDAIRNAGGPLEALLVKQHDSVEGKFVVMEGNRRLAAYKGLLKDRKDNTNLAEKLEKVPCEVYEHITQEQEFSILSILHLQGRKKWAAYEKASYLFRQWELSGGDYDKVADLAAERATTVKRQIETIQFMKENKASFDHYSHYYSIFANRDFQNKWSEDTKLLDRLHKTISEKPEKSEKKEHKKLTATGFRSLITQLFKDEKETQKYRDKEVTTSYAMQLRSSAAIASPFTVLQSHTDQIREFTDWFAANNGINFSDAIRNCKKDDPYAIQDFADGYKELRNSLEEYWAVFQQEQLTVLQSHIDQIREFTEWFAANNGTNFSDAIQNCKKDDPYAIEDFKDGYHELEIARNEYWAVFKKEQSDENNDG